MLLLNAEKKRKILKFINLFCKNSPFFISHITSNIFFFSAGKRLLGFLFGPQSRECTATHFKTCQWGAHDIFFKSYSQKSEKIQNFRVSFLYLYWPIFQTISSPLLIFFTILSRLYSLHHGALILFLSHSLSGLEFFF